MDEVEKAMYQLKIFGLMEDVANKLGGTLAGQEAIEKTLYLEFESINPKPKNVKKWLSERIEPLFKCVDEKPIWVCDPEWPYLDGKPMVFIKQFSVNDREDLRGLLTVDAVLYIFGILRPDADGTLVQEYRVVDQLPELAQFM